MTKETQVAKQVSFADINEPGTYVANWSGHLLRIPEDSIKLGLSPLLNIVGRKPLLVTKISENPYLPITKARQLAADLDCNVVF